MCSRTSQSESEFESEPESEFKKPPSSWWPESQLLNSTLSDGFMAGFLGSSAIYFLKGYFRHQDAPSSFRVNAGVRLAGPRSLLVGGAFAAVLGLGVVVENSLNYFHGREVALSGGVGSAVMGAAIMARRGAVPASCAALGFGGLGLLYFVP